LPYLETFDEYSTPKEFGYLPRYTADIAEAFEIVARPDQQGKCLRQVVAEHPDSWAPEYMPYTIIGDRQWQDYEVSADVYLNPGDTAGIMGRVNDVGYGYGSEPKGYFLQLDHHGHCRLVVIRGKVDKKKLVGDAEQQALIKAGKDEGEGGEKELGAAQLPNLSSNQWHHLKLRFEGSTITASVDGQKTLTATNALYSHGMAGLMAGGGKKVLSTPYFDNLLIQGLGDAVPAPRADMTGQTPIYRPQDRKEDQGR
jgi:galactosylceramidase